MRAAMWQIVSLVVFLALMTAMWALTLSVIALGLGGGWKWVCVAAIAFWPAWRAFSAVRLAADATVGAWRNGSTFMRELAWEALRASVEPGQAASMEINRIRGQAVPARKKGDRCDCGKWSECRGGSHCGD